MFKRLLVAGLILVPLVSVGAQETSDRALPAIEQLSQDEGLSRPAVARLEERWKAKIETNWPPHLRYLGIEFPFLAEVEVSVEVGVNGRVSQCSGKIVRTIGSQDEKKKGQADRRFIDSACRAMRRYSRFGSATDENGTPKVGMYSTVIRYDMK